MQALLPDVIFDQGTGLGGLGDEITPLVIVIDGNTVYADAITLIDSLSGSLLYLYESSYWREGQPRIVVRDIET